MSALAAVAAAGKAGLARALGRLEGAPDDAATLALLDEAYRAPRAHVVGITGPPGVGKSTLLGVLIAAWRRGDPARTVGVIAVDPSSRASGGALLGDRLRLNTDPDDAGVFVRSMAARDRLGGLAPVTVAAMVLMRALYDVVAIETVGVGQSEADVVDAADTVVFCIQPGSGDSLQFMKAGIVELPHVMAVTKADTGAAARRAVSEAAGALGLAVGRAEGWTVPVLPVSAQRREGIDALLAAVDGHWRHLADGRLAALRDAQATAWLRAAVRERFGRDGLGRAGELGLDRQSPFARMAALGRTLAH